MREGEESGKWDGKGEEAEPTGRLLAQMAQEWAPAGGKGAGVLRPYIRQSLTQVCPKYM